jgi:NAD(P)-dependent dehydrogenase (short-subunit alcohol dehydrogenase family)
MSERTVLVTGASSGIGRACALHFASRGCRVYGTSRSGKGEADGIHWLKVNVDDDASVTEAIDAIVKEAGGVDVVINNAGFAVAGSIEDTSIAEAKSQFETNVFGVLRVCRAVLPSMRARKTGLIVNISSLGGIFGMPFSGIYSASKFAVEGISEALRLETRAFGVKVVLVEPGDIRTNLPEARRAVAGSVGSPYERSFARVMELSKRDEDNAPDPLVVAELIGRIADMRSPKMRYTVGMFSQRVVYWLKRVLPVRLFTWVLSKAFET